MTGSSLYDQIEQLYNCLEEGEIKKAQEIMKVLVGKGADKGFIKTVMYTIGKSKMVEYLHDKASEELAKEKTSRAK